MKRILTVTLNPAIDYTLVVPDFARNAVNRARAVRRDPGGKGINVATALSQGGFETQVTGFLGRTNSLIFNNHFKDNSMRDSFLYLEGSTREGIKVVDPIQRETTDINLDGFFITNSDIDRLKNQFQDLLTGVDYVVLSGSLPPGVSKGIYADMACMASQAGAFVAVDTSGEALQLAIESGSVHLIKPNMEELGALYSELSDAEDIMAGVEILSQRLLKTVQMVALSLGREGSHLYTRQARYEANAPIVDVKSTVGAGDTFLAGLIAGLASGKNDAHSLAQGVCWAASTLTMIGPGLSKTEPPESFLNHTLVSKL
ncbi:1-phosphofructokinase family hexose kinase [Oceanispirochaeta crateris]|uniref:1-phosphofructokinase family hexose kinase n=1 Tax=Oceanispirochaeta crateris TaxID=2518645 RepID=A0A5C1QG79_9SPIO|nr:1-phosphofructokinase family hexose kinase [Oceanispirochaeta crateris]QEN07075.1 1-phosphofructokinase family hexose kinase [Oceanispirochaeta crateris]